MKKRSYTDEEIKEALAQGYQNFLDTFSVPESEIPWEREESFCLGSFDGYQFDATKADFRRAKELYAEKLF